MDGLICKLQKQPMCICDNYETEMKYIKWKTPIKGSVAVLAFPSKEIIP